MAIFTLLQLALSAASVTAVSIPPADVKAVSNAKLGFISMPLTRRENRKLDLSRRDNDVPLLNQSSVSYLIQLEIGSPGQSVQVAIDTGSDELWVNPDCSTAGSADLEAECKALGQYLPGSSSTSTVTTLTNYIPYGKGEVRMQYVMDNITLTNSTLAISQQIFGVALASNELNQGILGLSYGENVNLDYPNFVDQLFLQNQTNTRAFSIALGSKDTNNGGTLIFGGVDTKKFTGDLKSTPILPPQGGESLSRYWVNLTGIAYNNNGKSQAYSMDTTPVVLDSGSTLSYLPNAVVTAMANDFQGQYDSSSQLWIVPCSAQKTTNTMDFSFGGDITIRVPMYEFVWEAISNICVLGAVGIGSSDVALLGDSMMRGGYFVFDQTNAVIQMAQFASCGENEQVIPTGGSASSFKGECTQEDANNVIAGSSSSSSGGSSSTGGSSGSGSGSQNGVAILTGKLSFVVSLAVAVGFNLL